MDKVLLTIADGRAVRVSAISEGQSAQGAATGLPGSSAAMNFPRDPANGSSGPASFQVEAMAPVIVSASRSTDIPAFFASWFMKRLDAGYAVWVNPFNQVPSYVSFDRCRAVIFWSKNPRPMLKHLDRLDQLGLGYYFQYTMNDYERENLEPKVPPLAKRIETFRALSSRLGPDRVIWRWDPMILTPDLGPDEILSRVEAVGEQIFGLTRKLVFSFADVTAYRKVCSNLQKTGLYGNCPVEMAEGSSDEKNRLASGLAALRDSWRQRGWDLTLATCAEEVDLEALGIEKNRCIDPEILERNFAHDPALMAFLDGYRQKAARKASDSFDLFAQGPDSGSSGSDSRSSFDYKKFKDKGQRKACGCVMSKDIGMYSTCPHGCVYCYANSSMEAVRRNCDRFSSDGESLIPFRRS